MHFEVSKLCSSLQGAVSGFSVKGTSLAVLHSKFNDYLAPLVLKNKSKPTERHSSDRLKSDFARLLTFACDSPMLKFLSLGSLTNFAKSFLFI